MQREPANDAVARQRAGLAEQTEDAHTDSEHAEVEPARGAFGVIQLESARETDGDAGRGQRTFPVPEFAHFERHVEGKQAEQRDRADTRERRDGQPFERGVEGQNRRAEEGQRNGRENEFSRRRPDTPAVDRPDQDRRPGEDAR